MQEKIKGVGLPRGTWPEMPNAPLCRVQEWIVQQRSWVIIDPTINGFQDQGALRLLEIDSV